MTLAAFALWATLGLHAATSQWATQPAAPCAHTYAALIVDGGTPLAGNFPLGPDCVVWINTAHGRITGPEVCKLIVHEEGHLHGLQHSPNPRSVMFSPFRSRPVPAGCNR